MHELTRTRVTVPGYIIPKPVIDNFLFDFKHGKTGAIATFGLTIQLCENEALRRKFGLLHPNTCVTWVVWCA